MLKKILSLATIAVLAYACDKVEAPYVVFDNNNGATITYFGADSVQINNKLFVFNTVAQPVFKKVLMEEFTGHACGNCPTAGVYLNQTLQPQYGDSLVVISIHAGSFAEPTSSLPNQPAGSFQSDHRCQTGNDWFAKFNVSFFPSGMVDQKGYPSSHLKPYASWNANIQNRLALSPLYQISMQTAYDSVSRSASVAVQTKSLTSANDTLKLQVVLTEDSIIDWQEWYGHTPEYVPDFAHRHLLRGALNNSIGEVIYNGTIVSGDKCLRGYSYTLKPSWNAGHCHAVAFIADALTEEVLQVEEIKIIQ